MDRGDHLGMRDIRTEAAYKPTSQSPPSHVPKKAVVPPEIVSKVQRLGMQGLKPRVLDLFSGCGGLSLGFQSAGCDIVAAIECDPLAARSHALNLFRGEPLEILARHAKPRDITRVEPDELADEFQLGSAALAIDFVVGGPPCQAYARVGRAKLREIAAHPTAFKIDPRADLYLRYLDYVAQLKPLGILMENVPDILNFGGHNVVEEIVEVLDEMGYCAKYSLINSAHHGVPQMRDRVSLIALHKSLRTPVTFPNATRWCDLPVGYGGTRAVALKLVDRLFGNYVEPDTGHNRLPSAVTAKEALGDLPPIRLHLEGKLKRGARRFTELAEYRPIPFERLSNYASQMRQWPGFESGRGVFDHVIRSLPRDSAIFAAMSQGDEYPAAHHLACELFRTEARRRRISLENSEGIRLRRAIVPPYDPSKFPNRWWKLRANGPSRTLTAHIGKDTYSHIHYDSSQARVISVREAARLQSFPDGYVFSGTMNPAFRQIGNSVPPLMAKSLADEMIKSLGQALVRLHAAAGEFFKTSHRAS